MPLLDSNILIVEGTDATGKSTLCRDIAESTGRRYIHASAPKTRDWFDEYIVPLKSGEPVVCDRWHIGELIWPDTFGRPSLFESFAEYEHCTRILVELLGAQIIVVSRPWRDIAATLLERGEQDTTEITLRAQALYHDIAGRTKSTAINVYDIDTVRSRL